MTTPSQFSNLPEDIGRIIFELSVADRAPLSWTCALVSKKVQAWVELILYKHIVISTAPRLARLRSTIQAHPMKQDDFFSVQVKSLLVPSSWEYPQDDIQYVVSACAGVDSLLFWTDSSDFANTLKNLPSPPSPRHLAAFGSGFCHDLSNPIYHKVTHLWLTLQAGRNHPNWDELAMLSELTHLLIIGDVYHDAWTAAEFLGNSVLAHSPPSLRVVVLVGDDSFIKEVEIIDSVDSRIVVLVQHEQGKERLNTDVVLFEDAVELQYVWGLPSFDGRDIWSRAEAMIKGRLARTVSQR
ncbi:hypothetical protein DFP72DRAFT_496627 [Ephemerocybe angulata]|uniref:Uncharacterized protein n=1 Tax=Ephemerocybe angulata TaxID=980116 RepID=A0A8H6HQH4_9AGAR|nr:hypothetical protein DFP72DRAFT_496627 [Tulosesus angulatus]